MLRAFLFCSLLIGASAQYYCSVYRGTCSRSCSRYLTSALPLCPSGYLCCAPTTSSTNYCSTKYGGTCVNDPKSCNGKLYRGSNFNICPSSSQLCCVASQSTTTQRTTSSGGTGPKQTFGSGCGTTRVVGAQRVIGGSNARQGTYPWQVSLQKWNQHACGGTIINNQWIVTAGHCFRDYRSGMRITIVTGDHYLSSRDGKEEVIPVSKIFVHPSYVQNNPYKQDNDIALMKLSRKIALGTDYVNSACMPSNGENFEGSKDCYLSGWGLTKSTQNKNILQQVKGPLVSRSACRRVWGYSRIKDTQVCFGDGVKGGCQGDSGGPLVCSKNNKYYLVGVVSYGTKECTRQGYPTILTRVASFRNWIENTMNSN